MRSSVVSLGCVCVLLWGLARADAQVVVTNPDQTGSKTQPSTTEALPPGQYVGKILSVNPSGNSLVVQVTVHRKELKNPDGPTRTADQIVQDVGVEIQQIGQLDRNAVISRSLAEYQRRREEDLKAVSKFQKALPKQLNELAAQQYSPQPVEYVTISERKDVPLTTAKDVKVRLREVPSIDDDGRVRTKFTAEEIRKLKGDEPDQPGYNGKLRNLNPGEFIRVTVAPKPAPPPAENKAEEASRDTRTNITEVTAIIVITREQAALNEAGRP